MKITIDGTIYTDKYKDGFVVFEVYADMTGFLGYFANLHSLATYIDEWNKDGELSLEIFECCPIDSAHKEGDITVDPVRVTVI